MRINGFLTHHIFQNLDGKEVTSMKKIIFALVAVVMVVVSALFVLPILEGESTQTHVFSRGADACGGN